MFIYNNYWRINHAKQKEIAKVHIRRPQSSAATRQIRQNWTHSTNRLTFLKFRDRNRKWTGKSHSVRVDRGAAKEQIRTISILLIGEVNNPHSTWKRASEFSDQLHPIAQRLRTYRVRDAKVHPWVQDYHVPWWIWWLWLLALLLVDAASVLAGLFSNSFDHKFRGRPKGSKNRRKESIEKSSQEEFVDESNKKTQEKRGRGRPKGAKNIKKQQTSLLDGNLN